MGRIRRAFAVTCAAFALAGLPPAPAHAALRLPHILGDHMVLQRSKPVPVWGWAAPDEQITLEIADQSHRAVADAKGKWSVTLRPMPEQARAFEMKIDGSSGDSIIVHDILVGEVWMGSGQSNMVMELPADRHNDPPPDIRVFQVTKAHAVHPVDDVEGEVGGADT